MELSGEQAKLYRKTVDDTLEAIQRSTRLYARRQRTWANSMEGISSTLAGAEVFF